jgi:uncharacterized membrane protein (UPF0127 family)
VALPAPYAPVSFRSVKPFFFAFAVVAAVAACSSDRAGVATPTMPVDTVATTTSVVFPNGTIIAKIAATDSARTNGLMNVTTLAANAGMLFVFQTDQVPAACTFYMKNTPLPLSIAFIDSNMRVINVDEMAAESLTYHGPTGNCRYVVEANQGWFTSHGVAAGTVVSFTLPAGTIVDP